MVFNIFKTFSSRSEDTFKSTSEAPPDFTARFQRFAKLNIVEDEVETNIGRYTGQLTETGIPHGHGLYIYHNGVRYQGSVQFGKREGFGSLSMLKNNDDPTDDLWRVTGSWVADYPNVASNQWVIVYSDGSTYVGPISVRSDSPSISGFKTFSIRDILKHGNGEYHTSKEKYFGSFDNDQKSGYGVWILEDRNSYTRYEGSWKNDKFDGFGTYTHADGTVFVGQFKSGKRYGNGSLLFPNGDSISGDWKDNETAHNSKYVKGSIDNRMLTTLYRSQYEISKIIPKKKYNGYLMANNEGYIGGSALKWNLFKQDNIISYQSEKQEVAKLCKDIVLDTNICDTTFKNHEISLIGGSLTSNKFFNSVLKLFLASFEGSFSRNTTKRWQKTEFYFGIEDVRSVVSFLCDEVWDLFQSIFVENKAAIMKLTSIDERMFERTLKYFHRQSNVYISDFMQDCLAKLPTSLFDLYKQYFKDKDLLLSQKLQTLKNCSLEAFQVRSDFIPSAAVMEEDQVPYAECIKMLEQLNDIKTVTKKIEAISQLRERVFEQMAMYRHWNRLIKKGLPVDKSAPLPQDGSIFDALGAEDCAPVLYYILVQSNITTHNAQISFIYDWRIIDEENPVITLLTFYDSFCEDVLRMDPSLKTSDGVVISCPMVVSSLKKGIRYSGAGSDHGFWISPLLIYLSTVVEGKRPGDSVPIGKSLPADVRDALISNRDQVNQILNYTGHDQPKPLLGCKIVEADAIEDSTDQLNYVISLQNVFPASLYSETAFLFVNDPEDDD